MKTILLVLTLLLWLGTSAQESTTAAVLLKRCTEKLAHIKNGQYHIAIEMKYMLDKDTVRKSADVRFQRLPGDTIGSKLYNLTADSFLTVYDGVNIYNIDIAQQTVSETYTPQYGWDHISSYELYPPLIQGDFGHAPGSTVFLMPDTVIARQPCFHLLIQQPDESDLKNIFSHEFIRKKDTLPIRTVNTVAFQGVYQYQAFTLSDIQINSNIPASLFALPAWTRYYSYSLYSGDVSKPSLEAGIQAPDWQLPSLQGDTIRFRGLQKKVVLLEFWYMACQPCIKAMPELEKIRQQYQGKNVEVIGINIYDTDKQKIRDFLSKRNINYTILLGNKALAENYHISGYPTLYLVDGNGKIHAALQGYYNELYDHIIAEMNKLLQ
ncbi:TlpA family protein disulfide reductase [Chitinophaga vietnamensis]|uniref:TlpA family protein disulfide reductase n=1 Tax=Chitinophaga vietnamensis TaxID=2593957 RepID=UPI001177DB8A|nr:TlpA disulfide reductase family protein [Chitinophaga vietnamensis]